MSAERLCSKCNVSIAEDDVCTNGTCSSNAPTWRRSSGGQLINPDTRLDVTATIFCKACTKPNTPNASYCVHCGYPTSPSAQFRHVLSDTLPAVLIPKFSEPPRAETELPDSEKNLSTLPPLTPYHSSHDVPTTPEAGIKSVRYSVIHERNKKKRPPGSSS